MKSDTYESDSCAENRRLEVSGEKIKKLQTGLLNFIFFFNVSFAESSMGLCITLMTTITCYSFLSPH